MLPLDKTRIDEYKKKLSITKKGDLNPSKKSEVIEKIKQSFIKKINNFQILNLTKEQLLKELDAMFTKSQDNLKIIMTSLRHNRALTYEIERHTNYLPNDTGVAERLYHLRNTISEKGGCKTCGKETKFETYRKGYKEFCSRECVQNNTEIIGRKNEKRKGKINQWKAKFKKTNLERYGVVHPSQSGVTKEKNKRIFYSKLVDSSRLKNLVKPLFPLKEYEGTELKYKFQCLKCNNIFEDHLDNGRIPRCYNCYPIITTRFSKYEDEIEIWLKSLNINCIKRNVRSIIKPLELDIYLPEYKLAIEFNGLWSHSEIGGNKDRHYHLTKTNLCKEKGVELIHIFEDEWINKQDIVKSIIKNKLRQIKNKIYARECEIRQVGNSAVYDFLFNNHLQEPLIGIYNYGLYFNDELVYLIALSKPRFNKNYEYELVRSCGKMDAIVIGGFNKLVEYVMEKLEIKSIISYVDKRYFDGKGYKDWDLINETNPNYFYTKEYLDRESRLKYQKHKLGILFPQIYEDNLTEWQIMQLAGYDRTWDCGNKVFVKKLGNEKLNRSFVL